MEEEPAYRKNAAFWRKTTPRILSDIAVKPEAVTLLAVGGNSRILEAGCGSGFVTRLVAQAYPAAEIHGCDISAEMLEAAVGDASPETKRVTYRRADVTALTESYPTAHFDALISSSVILHFDLNDYSRFLRGAHAVLRSGGVMVISTLHPFLFQITSPTRNERECWVKHRPLTSLPLDTPQPFEETLFDVDGKTFISEVWYLPLSALHREIVNSGFRITDLHEKFVHQDHLISPRWGKIAGYPAYLQIRAEKSSA